jgi:hypothetical protein
MPNENSPPHIDASGSLSPTDIQTYYEQIKPALEPLGKVLDNPTGLVYDKQGWYRTRENDNVDEINNGFEKKRRMQTIHRDFDHAVTQVDRSLYVLTSYKSPNSMTTWTAATRNGTGYQYESGKSPTPDTADLRAVGAWGDIDLADELKPKRGNLAESTRAIAEEALQAYADEFATLYGGYDAIFMLDSVGGAYIFGAPSVTLPIADLFADDPEARRWTFQEFIDRSNSWLRDAEERVNNCVSGARRVIDPDWANNKNRQYKAPLSLHSDHAAVVTPIDPRAVSYSVTPIEDVDAELLEEVRSWSDAVTSVEYTSRITSVIASLWPNYIEDANSWQEALRVWVEDKREQKRRREQRRLEAEKRRQDLSKSLEDAQLTTDRSLVDAAIERIDVRELAKEVADIWHGEKTPPRFGPPWHESHNSGQSTFADRDKFHDTGDGLNGNAAVLVALADGISDDDELTGAEFPQAIEALRDRGYSIPVWVPEVGTDRPDGTEYDQTPLWVLRKAAVVLGICEPDDFVEQEAPSGTYLDFPDTDTRISVLEALDERGIDHGWKIDDADSTTAQYQIQSCAPPVDEGTSFDVETRWDALQGERYDEFLGADSVTVFADPPGTGKTTNAALAAANRGRPYSILFSMHEKAREFIKDSATPDNVYHLKGAEQKKHDECMDADHQDEPCPTHGATTRCPSMCSIYDLPSENPLREQFERVVEEVGPVQAHVLLDPHDGSDCAYIQQFDELEYRDAIVGVHEYLQLESVAKDGRDVLVDEKPRSLLSERTLSTNQLLKLERTLTEIGDSNKNKQSAATRTLQEVGEFAGRVARTLSDGRSLANVQPPQCCWTSYETYSDVAGHYREFERPSTDKPWQYGEAFAKAKLKFNEILLTRIEDGTWSGVPLAFDALIAAAIEAGHPHEPLSKAIALPRKLSRCPRCSRELAIDESGTRVCDHCDWREDESYLIKYQNEQARAAVELGSKKLYYRSLPLLADLPSAPLILDATATPDRIGALFGDPDPLVTGDETLEGNMELTQITDGQYHAGTVQNSASLRDKIQSVIDEAGQQFDQPLFVMKQGLQPEFDFPSNSELLHYHAARGLNRAECDAVFCIGAPHPRIADLRTEAELLAQHRDDLRAGGTEYSNRRENGELAANPPVYRKLNYETEDGHGRAVPTKHYSGLIGALFREVREKELVQAVHRVRPLLAQDTKHAYLITNVPTSLPVDRLVELDDLASPIRQRLSVSDRAIDLLHQVAETACGQSPDLKRLPFDDEGSELHFTRGDLAAFAEDCGIDVSKKTISNWVSDFEDLGLLVEGDYIPQEGNRLRLSKSTLKRALTVMSNNACFKVDKTTADLPPESPADWDRLAQALGNSESQERTRARSTAD